MRAILPTGLAKLAGCAPRSGRLRGALLLLLAGCAPSTEALYARYTDTLTAAGRMRVEREPRDAPFTDADLVENFQRVAFAVESFNGQEAGERTLRRWQGPIRYKVLTDRSVDTAAVDTMMERLSGLTGIEVERVDEGWNLAVFFIDGRMRQGLARHLDGMEGEGAAHFAQALRVGDTVSPCHAGMFGDPRKGVIQAAYVIIKDETEGILRQACIEEELAQTMGLTNDDPRVRPSIFNDDQEFALMTAHDALLLRMLYHPRLKPGMTRAQAGPLLPGVIADLRRGRR